MKLSTLMISLGARTSQDNVSCFVSRTRCGVLHAAPQTRDPPPCTKVRWAPALQRTTPQGRRAALRPGHDAVIARSVATKQSSLALLHWIASRSLSSGRRSRTRWLAMTESRIPDAVRRSSRRSADPDGEFPQKEMSSEAIPAARRNSSRESASIGKIKQTRSRWRAAA
jgi:hypothetical protein